MVNKISNSISKALFGEFGKGYKIYDENIEQGLKEPCFLVEIMKPSVEPKLTTRALRNNPFHIVYFPKKGNTEMIGVAERMIRCLEYIAFDDGLIRGSNISFEIQDDVLHFFIEYNIHTVAPIELENMEELEIKSEVNHD